jgi:hypothetical protein
MKMEPIESIQVLPPEHPQNGKAQGVIDWSRRSMDDLYPSRWTIEVFFKQIKQTLKLGDFLGHSANAMRWQIWTALLRHSFFLLLMGWH